MNRLEYVATYVHRGPSVLDLIVLAVMVIGLMVFVLGGIVVHNLRDPHDAPSLGGVSPDVEVGREGTQGRD